MPRGKGGQAQGDQVGVGAALVVGFDAGDGFVEPGEGRSWVDSQTATGQSVFSFTYLKETMAFGHAVVANVRL